MQLRAKTSIKLLIAAASLAAFSTSYAGSYSYNNFFDGPILGVSGGYIWGSSSDVTTKNISPIPSTTTSETQHGWVGNGFVGYGYGFNNNFYFGARARGSAFTSDQVSYSTTSGNISTKNKASPLYGGVVEIEPGFIIKNRFLVYLNGGGGSDRYKFKQSQTNLTTSTETTVFNNKEWINEGHVGVGVSFAINHYISTGIEYDRVFSETQTMYTNPTTGVKTQFRPDYNVVTWDFTAHLK